MLLLLLFDDTEILFVCAEESVSSISCEGSLLCAISSKVVVVLNVSEESGPCVIFFNGASTGKVLSLLEFSVFVVFVDSLAVSFSDVNVLVFPVVSSSWETIVMFVSSELCW